MPAPTVVHYQRFSGIDTDPDLSSGMVSIFARLRHHVDDQLLHRDRPIYALRFRLVRCYLSAPLKHPEGPQRAGSTAVIDLYSRRVVGWSMSASMTAHLAVDGGVEARQARCPDASRLRARRPAGRPVVHRRVSARSSKRRHPHIITFSNAMTMFTDIL